MTAATIAVGEEQAAFFREHGYLVIEAITTPREVAQLRAVCDRLFAERAGREEGNQYDLAGTDEEDRPARLPQIVNPVNYDEALRDTLFRANAAAAGRGLLGEDAGFDTS
ncbi:MAG: phytanoyl-CoA dioxygenase family protein, partial [Gemmatimonadetes bacterium]|nr:phytanoyl-CoA dioxygenase family protein [Gemmatimonadota bacterium]